MRLFTDVGMIPLMKLTSDVFARYPLVLIEWEDSTFLNPGWMWVSELNAPLAGCVSVGFLVVDDQNTKVLACSLSDREDQSDIQLVGSISIPTSCIKRMVPITL